MYRKYIDNPSTIILVVMPADQDFTNTEANIIAAEKDPQKIRTLGIITKIDRHMSHFGQKLQNNDLDYKLGIYLVRNRTQEELEEKIDYDEVRKREELILSEQELESFPQSQKGTNSLIKILIKLQNDQVVKEKNRVREDIVKKLRDIRKEIKLLPEPCNLAKQKNHLFQRMINRFEQDLDKLYFGNYGNDFMDKDDHLRARIDEMFENHSIQCYQLQNNYLISESRYDIQSLLSERKGVQLYNFISFQCFSEHFSKQIEKLQKPTEILLQEIFEYLEELYSKIISKNFSRFEQLEETMKKDLTLYLQNIEDTINENLKLQFQKESAVIFTKNPLYIDVLDQIKICIKNEIQDLQNQQLANNSNNLKKEKKKQEFEIYDLKIQKSQCCSELFKADTANSTFEYQTTEIQLSLFSYSNTLFKRLMDYIYQEILYQIGLLSNNLKELYIYFINNYFQSFEDQFSPYNGTKAHESNLWISNSNQIENKRSSLEKSLKILTAALAKFQEFEQN